MTEVDHRRTGHNCDVGAPLREFRGEVAGRGPRADDCRGPTAQLGDVTIAGTVGHEVGSESFQRRRQEVEVCDADSQDNFAGLKFLAILEFDLEAAPGCEVNLSYPFLFQIGDALLLEGEAIGAERLQPNGAPGITIRFPGLLAKTFQRVGLVGVT
jgi:hypothetical protein